MTLTSMAFRVRARHVGRKLDLDETTAPEWDLAESVRIAAYWSGVEAPETRRFDVRLLWSDSDLYVRFDAEQHEPLVLNAEPRRSKKTIGLWERDVCEIFIAPDRQRPNRYFEFEIAPSGEWLDLAIEVKDVERMTDWEYSSGMQAWARIETTTLTEIIRIPFDALGCSPTVGDIWLGNMFRCVGSGPGRGYLAWQPTGTPLPNFHVPEAFGEFEFVY